MASLKTKIKDLALSEHITIAELERTLGFANGSISKWDKQSPSADRLQKVANYFDVSADYLLGNTDKKHYYDLSEKDIHDIGREVDRMIAGLKSNAVVNYYGEPMTDTDKEKVRIAMEAALQAAQIEARKKFTPKKYRDND
ncbi:helix-turn-helix transcriptional regulator [Lactiplantibacillus plantarum]|uniref:helix-turn-helix domain-containing protein n=1 Tax=Lactiplantibacillus plantarum TaxID=1590 RepID=UPI0015ECA4F0|nr:helix-turn-helix transcriptional regulator [Lactiplantibacillus plantarum]QLQ50932.1 helix-turn-helix transcriptional regulator [Lactiplantibacillus plantarum]